MQRFLLFAATVFLLALTFPAFAQKTAARPRVEFNRLVAHWAEYADPAYLDFLSEARPEIAQVGFYGGHFWSLAHTPHGKGYPAHFPVVGLDECGQWFENLNKEIHKRGIKVVGHFNVEFLVGDPETSPPVPLPGKKKGTVEVGPRGFFKFYRDLWDEKTLGPRPVKDPLDLLEKNADGSPITNNSYSIGGMKEYWGCLNNPHWRAVLKTWVKAGIQRGVDGFISNYFYRHNCLCEHCQSGFRSYLADRFSAGDLQAKFGIQDVKTHKFTEIVSWHNPKESTPLRLEMLRFSQISIKLAYEDVFVKHGRSLKPDLILAQWNHLGNFSQISGDERCLLPKELWGRDEDYTWYSTGAAACFTDLAEGILGEGTLQARYIRGAFDDKPFTLGKYESTRIRVAIAELAANGGAPMGFYTRFKDPMARKEIVRYYNFIEKHTDLYRGNRSHAEVVLLFPRSKVHQGDVEAVEAFRKVGKELLDRHVLFDVLPDDLVDKTTQARYQAVVTVADSSPKLPDSLSRFTAPATVRVSADRPAKGEDLIVHLVNYNREEPAKKRSPGGGIVDEKPLPVKGIAADLQLPKGYKAGKVAFLTPEDSAPGVLDIQETQGRLRFQAPPFLVYAVVRIQLVPETK